MTDEEIVLRALLVDEQCRALGTMVVARSEAAISAFDPSRILDEAFTRKAVGIILVRGTRVGVNERLSVDEVSRAMSLWSRSSRLGIPLLDYVLVSEDGYRGLFAIGEAERLSRR